MQVIPALDIRRGKVVRLVQGLIELETVYSESPAETAERWSKYGVELLHLVDLDGAMEGKPINLDIVMEITKRIKTKIELGGGIRDEKAVRRALHAGADKVVLGTRALDEKFLAGMSAQFPGRIVVSIDAKHGLVYTQGWLFETEVKAIDLIKKLGDLGIKTVNYTDISRDGTLKGPNIESLKTILKATSGMTIVASGGVSSIEDVKCLKALASYGLSGIIIGKALYENKIDLAEAMAICKG
jgi:phosphoribosylformimino-5-aminoimidazole carboxamide ribotide isomerase